MFGVSFFIFGYVKSIHYLCFTMEDMKTTQSISEIHIQADLLYATNRDEYQVYIESLSCDQMKSLDEHQRNERFTDPNFSYGAERVTCLLAGKQHHDLGEKHGDDSSDNAEAKPEKTKKEKKLLSGNVSFADMSLEKIEQLTQADTEILSSGFFEGTCLYVVGIKMNQPSITERLTEQFESKMKKNQRRVLSFSRTQYCDSDSNKLYYINPKIESFKESINKKQYEFLMNLQKLKK